MRTRLYSALIVCICIGMGVSQAQTQTSTGTRGAALLRVSDSGRRGKNHSALTDDDRLSLLAAALDSKLPRYSERDCSHLVHAIYEKAGFPYAYASSDDLYDGVHGFERVKHPEPGDLIVWHGHAGIVVQPSHHLFYSFEHAGPGVDNYESRYWEHRGHARFYRYVKNNSCPGCILARERTSDLR